MRSKTLLSVREWGFVFFALAPIQLLIFMCTNDPGLDKGKTKPRALDAG